MSCSSFEDLLLTYSDLSVEDRHRLDLHVTGCEDCRTYRDLLHRVDNACAERLGKVQASEALKERVYAKVSVSQTLAAPSPVPEILDLIGWIAVGATALTVTWRMALNANVLAGPGPDAILWLVTGFAVASATWIGVRVYSELKS